MAKSRLSHQRPVFDPGSGGRYKLYYLSLLTRPSPPREAPMAKSRCRRTTIEIGTTCSLSPLSRGDLKSVFSSQRAGLSTRSPAHKRRSHGYPHKSQKSIMSGHILAQAEGVLNVGNVPTTQCPPLHVNSTLSVCHTHPRLKTIKLAHAARPLSVERVPTTQCSPLHIGIIHECLTPPRGLCQSNRLMPFMF